ncbi:type II CAAX endopeptidase family protein [Lactiplantibacillus sp. WILCCON 0030]|uniref:Type II CAAX endopeptidase family protein n=1 Tax=Lactiplantibacillus brownii TaxID=3069269 RepID=A0ABU1ABG4_9LACO|nr:type II CAAX endopeptidase family protein [Lactiplantibacillus brownii]MDQ7938206.1 type II CAAX endopeptidase family protein [Lactiplantibacillus brownii]
MTAYVDQPFRRWYLGQLVVLMGAALLQLLIVQNGDYFATGGLLLIILFLGGLLPAYETGTDYRDWPHFRRFNHYFQAIFQFTVMPLLVMNLVAMLSKWTPLDSQGLIAVAFFYLIFMFVPIGYVTMEPVKSLIGRILLLISVVFSGLIGAQATMLAWPVLKAPAVFEMVGNSGILGAFGFVLTVGVLLMVWGVRGPAWRLNQQADWRWLTLIGVVSVAFIIWNAFGAGESWQTTFTQFAFKLQAFSWKMFLGGLEPGIAEEWLYRFAVLGLLLRAFKQHRHQLDWAVGLSSGLFGLWHLTNALAGQALTATLEQMIFAASLGGFLAISYLYSGSILVPMTIHAGVDIFSMMASGSQTMAKPDAFEWQTIIFTVIVFGLITIFFLTGKRRQVMQAQVDRY